MALQAYDEFERGNHPDDEEAYRVNYGAFKGGLSREEIAEYYNGWAESGLYDSVRKQFPRFSILGPVVQI